MSTETHYQLFGVRDDADIEVIKAVYRALIRKNHPDVAGPSGAAKTAQLNDAFSELSDPVRRREYDRKLKAELPPASAGRSSGRQAGSYMRDSWDEEYEYDEQPSYAGPVYEEPEYTIQANPPESSPFSYSRLRFWMILWLASIAVLGAAMWYLCWTSFWAPTAPAVFRGLPAAFIAPAFAIAFFREHWLWLRGAVALGVLLGLAAAPDGSPIHFLTSDITTESFAALVVLGVCAVLVRVAGPRARSLFRMRPRNR